MHIFKKTADLQNHLNRQKLNGKTLGFVPTMGALHEGHISLVDIAKNENDMAVSSIFVNPTQFNDPEDLKKYPRTIEKDIEMLHRATCEVLFLPGVDEIYPQGFEGKANFDFGDLEKILEGKSRPGHFKGVAQVVSRLLDIVQPDVLYLGQKDYQQFMIVRKMLEQLKSGVKLVMCPIVREEDGLAMSSRNVRLPEQHRKDAVILSQTLFSVKERSKRVTVSELKDLAVKNIQSVPSARLDYFEICDAATLHPVRDWKEAKQAIALTAATFGTIRLIDNVLL